VDSVELERINRALINRWGGRPLFRVVFSETEFEVRDNGSDTELSRKYPFNRHCYILEKDVIEQGKPAELKTWNGYEIIWPFQHPKTNEPVDPNERVCMFLTEALMTGVKRTLQDHYDADKKQFDREVQEAYDILENESPYMATMLQNKEAIVVPDMKKVK
jgi:hypothetical protein